MTIPNILCVIRMVLVPVLLAVAWEGHAHAYIGILIFAFFLDLIDGPIARWTGQVSALGPRLDTWADFVLFITLPIGIWWLWPDIILQEWLFVILMLASLVLPALFGLIKFRGTSTSYHTWLAKLAVACMAVSVIILLIGGPAWPFRIAAVICMLAAIEQFAITWLLKRPASDVQTLYHILQQQQGYNDKVKSHDDWRA